VGGAASPALDLRTVERPLLERSWAKAKIQSLIDGGDPKGDVAQKIVSLSTTYRVLSPYTSLLVLETEADFARFRIDRKALADVLTVSGGKLAVARPSAPTLLGGPSTGTRVADADPPATAASPWRSDALGADPLSARGSMWGEQAGEASGAGGLGLTGIGEGGGGRGEGIGLGGIGTLGHGASAGTAQGFGSGYGRLGGAHRVEPPRVRAGTPQVSGRIPTEVIQRIARQNFGRFRLCYENGLRERPDLAGRMAVRFVIQRDGSVSQAAVMDLGTLTPQVASCVARAFYALSFPAPEGSTITVVYPLTFGPESLTSRSPSRTPARPLMEVPRPPAPTPPPEAVDKRAPREPYTGRFKTVMDLLSAGGPRAAMETAYAWHREAPGDVMALVALGEALEGAREPATAARVYGSIVDLFPARADLRRFAGERLERLGEAGTAEAIDTFRKAEEERPDHPQSHRLLAYALLRRGDFAGAFAAAERGLHQGYPSGRFAGVQQILREDLGLVAAAWTKAEPGRREEISGKLDAAGGTREVAPSLRFVLSWETDANDVDFHVHDAEGNHAYYKSPELATGGRLYADVTTGYGPECFTIRLPREKRSARYKLEAHYYSRGPMGYGMGKLEIVDHDGQGGITFAERPFVVMADGAFVDLGTFPDRG
jgi:tetratricopeptide (TPR) repeat protein